MATEPDQIRAEIEATREELALDVDRLADRTSPKRIAERRWDNVKSAFRRTSDRVMGPSQSAGSSVKNKVSNATDKAQDAAQGVAERTQGAAQSVAQTAREMPQKVTRQTQGNPLAVGLIAFGVGLLAASLLPTTEAESRAGERLADQADKVVEPLKEAGREMGQELKEKAKDSAQEVKGTAQEAVQTTKEQAKDSGQQAVQETKQSVKS
jgi:ElaB/YqjD/DUF883 family membrane-anchored ribosome-binding protein